MSESRHGTRVTLSELVRREGQHLGTSDWHVIDQARIDAFADATLDSQWIHTDPSRAAGGPFGTTIAHGYLSLAMVARFLEEVVTVTDVSMAINYGLDRVRFPAPVPVGARVRGHVELGSTIPVPSGYQAEFHVTVESGASAKPACVADVLARYLT